MNSIVAIILGAVVAAPVVVLVYILSRERGLDFLAVQLAAIAAVYVGPSLTDGHISSITTEVTGVVVFVLFSLFGRWNSRTLLAVGYFAHGGWDAVHHWGAIATFLPDWYAPFCLGYDWVMAAVVLARFVRPNAA